MKVLFNTTPRVRNLLPGHQTGHSYHLGWNLLHNGKLIAAAELAGYDVMITWDRRIFREQRHLGRKLLLVVRSLNGWPELQAAHERIREAVENATPGSNVYLDLKTGETFYD